MEDQNVRKALFGFGSLTVLVIGLFAAFIAGITTASITTAIAAVLLEPSVKQMEGFICPEGTTISYYSVRRSYHEPGESETHVECVSPDGSVQDVTGAALVKTIGVSFAGGFLICCIPITLLTLLLALLLGRQAAKKSKMGSPKTGGPEIERIG